MDRLRRGLDKIRATIGGRDFSSWKGIHQAEGNVLVEGIAADILSQLRRFSKVRYISLKDTKLARPEDNWRNEITERIVVQAKADARKLARNVYLRGTTMHLGLDSKAHRADLEEILVHGHDFTRLPNSDYPLFASGPVTSGGDNYPPAVMQVAGAAMKNTAQERKRGVRSYPAVLVYDEKEIEIDPTYPSFMKIKTPRALVGVYVLDFIPSLEGGGNY